MVMSGRRRQQVNIRQQRRDTLFAMATKKGKQCLCFVCKKPVDKSQATLEHILPLSKGGTDEMSNLAISHKLCNNRRGNVTK